ncbi:hypothetical protein L1277_001172 [Okibacterium sp. HSC-33S16]|uniref:hypothetical protein n=1 Tax=Okibacterium sp. HSC-33S16 TaxID=2910965 RepID=UPI00209DCBFB|nr:hypothetical protein [Okibacterium sp. HSC-33S16]MCP2031081.1 hypothetical protein [Okibacterium sp. HSC-33S16]
MNADAVDFLRRTTEGTRVVIRYLLDDGQATDALGWFMRADDGACVIAGKRGMETVRFDRVIAAKEVPAPPAPRSPRRREGY